MRKPKASSPENREFKVKVLSRLRRERGPAGQRGASARALQGRLPASKKVREYNKGKRSGPG